MGLLSPSPPAESVLVSPEAMWLTSRDTCDATASGVEAAQVLVRKGGLVLCLCKHHFERNEIELILVSGWVIAQDTRAALR